MSSNLQSSIPQNIQAHYRSDIDGLRAVAVLSVILFHLNNQILPGGFVGVDIFFVISGFLITRNILLDSAKNKFSLVDFYRRRVKRIAPVMLVVVALTIAAANMLLLPEDARNATKSGFASLFSLGNVYFWLYQDTGYFAADSSQLPLLHLWSLGVEEQFYIFWPVILTGLLRYCRLKTALFIAIGITAASFLLAEILLPTHPSLTYYLLPTRAGELLIGAIVAILSLSAIEQHLPRYVLFPLALFGLLMILGSVVFLNAEVPFPGWAALPATLGAAFIILAGHCKPNLISKFLAMKPFVWVGLVSYSAYLWHWPILSFYRYAYGEPGLLACIAAFIATFIAAAASYHFIEQPTRHSKAPAMKVFLKQFIIPSALIGILSCIAIWPAKFGIEFPNSTYMAALTKIQDQTKPSYLYENICQRQHVLQKDLENERCILGAKKPGEPKTILWGDSNAAHFAGMLEVLAKQAGGSFRNIAVGSCPPLSKDPKEFVKPTRYQDCVDSTKIIWPALSKYDTIIISASYTDYIARSPNFMPEFFKTLDKLIAEGKSIILIGKIPLLKTYDRRCREKALRYPYLQCPDIQAVPSEEILTVNDQLRRFSLENPNAVNYFDPIPYVCPGGICNAYEANGDLKYFDESHLGHPASIRLGETILTKSGIPGALEKLRN